MKYTLLITLAIIFIFHNIESDPYTKYENLNSQYNNTLPLNLFVEILTECERQNTSVNMMISISYKESHFKNIIGFTGFDIGYFQINIAQVGKNEKFTDYYDIKKNVRKGISIYKSALRRSKGDLRYALVYYNAGENCNVSNYKKEQWIGYVYFILKNYNISNQIDRRRIVIK